MLYIRKSHPRFKEMYADLIQAQADWKEGAEAIIANIDNEIQDVRLKIPEE